MPGQIAQYGAQMLVNTLCGNATPVLASSAPTWEPGMIWIDTASTPTLNYWNGAEWVAGSPSLYLALLISDPASSGASGGAAVNIADLGEDTPPSGVSGGTYNYSRQSVAFADASGSVPATSSNTGTIQFGPYGANQPALVQWAALVTAQSGTSGLLLYTWTLDTPQQVAVSEPIVIPAGALSFSEQ